MSSHKQPSEQSTSVYQKHQKIYPKRAFGFFANLRITSILTLLGIYYLLPWLEWGERQAVLLDLPARKFYIFGFTFWPQDFFYLSMLLVIAALSLFFFTTLAGRLWCGYACPQTVWTEVYIWMERLVEGSRTQQIKLDQRATDAYKLKKKLAKYALWGIFSLWTGFTFVGYFTPIRELGDAFIHFNTSSWETFWIFFYAFATLGNAGFLREQICIYMCPYARFQSAMFDHNTLIISYDANRGEPRGSRKKEANYKADNLGECIDCNQCVHVCPTGIDIREGLQYQCIGCAACVDVCDEVMEKMSYPKGLIRYTTENTLAGQPSKIIHFRTILYASLLMAITVALLIAVATRLPLELDIIRDRNMLYRETNLGLTENVYTLKILNMEDQPHRYKITASGLPDLKLVSEKEVYELAGGEVLSFPVQLQVDPIHLKRASSEVEFTVTAIDKPELTQTQTARFIGPTS